MRIVVESPPQMIRTLLLVVLALLFLNAIAATGWLLSRYESHPDSNSQVVVVPAGSPISPAQASALSTELAAYRVQHGLPSLSVAVGMDDQLAYSGAFGYADLAAGLAATPDSLYRIGSVSKSITAVALGALMESERINIDLPFHHYVPEFPEKRWPFSLRQLASHTAGVRHYREGFFDSLAENFHGVHYDKVADALTLVADDPLRFEPNSAYYYSSYGYNMLSAAMVNAGGEPFRAQLDRYVFTPAEMARAHAEDVRNPDPASVAYYLLVDGRALRAPRADNSYKVAGGGIVTTPGELVAFGNALLAGRLVDGATMTRLFTPHALKDGSTEPQSYGLGFQIWERQVDGAEYLEVGHGGSSVGGLTAFLMYPESGLVIAVTTNVSVVAGRADPRKVARAIADRLLPLLAEQQT
ncbi:MAG: serine hydrolase domain-containing protein [Pseudomonadota bacterium]